MKKIICKKKNGFTLLELIVVLVILALLAAILIPALTGYIDRAKGVEALANARMASMASTCGVIEWKAAGSPGNGDAAYKKNIEQEIIIFLDYEGMQSYAATGSPENSVEVALSLPSYYSQG